MNELSWLVIMTKPRMESIAELNLIRQGFEVYLPSWVDFRRRSGTWRKVQSAMFPRYLFMRQVNSEQSISPIRSTRGVSQIVRFGIRPAWASNFLIKEIRLLEASRNEKSDLFEPFKSGDEVIVMQGPFKGVSAEVLSSNQYRVILLMQLLGKTQKLQLESSICNVQ